MRTYRSLLRGCIEVDFSFVVQATADRLTVDSLGKTHRHSRLGCDKVAVKLEIDSASMSSLVSVACLSPAVRFGWYKFGPHLGKKPWDPTTTNNNLNSLNFNSTIRARKDRAIVV